MERAQMVREVGMAQRLLIWAVLASIAGWIVPFAFILAIPFQLYCVYKLARALGFSTAICVLYLVAMFVPLASLIFLLVLNQKATTLLTEAGIKVGLMGARPSDLPNPSNE